MTKQGEKLMKAKVVKLLQECQIKVLNKAIAEGSNEYDKVIGAGIAELLQDIQSKVEQL